MLQRLQDPSASGLLVCPGLPWRLLALHLVAERSRLPRLQLGLAPQICTCRAKTRPLHDQGICDQSIRLSLQPDHFLLKCTPVKAEQIA